MLDTDTAIAFIQCCGALFNYENRLVKNNGKLS